MNNVRILHIDSNDSEVGFFPLELSVYEVPLDINTITFKDDEYASIPTALPEHWEN